LKVQTEQKNDPSCGVIEDEMNMTCSTHGKG